MKKVNVLHVFNIMNRGGAETFIMNVNRNINRNKICFNYLCTSDEKGDYDDEIKSLGGNIYHLRQRRNTPISNMVKLYLFFKNEGPFDVIHIPVMFYSGIICLIAKLAGIKKIIVHSHNAGESKRNSFFRKLYRKIMRVLINNFSDYKLSCGEDAATFLYGSTKNVIIINNGIDVDKFQKKDINKINLLKKEFRIKNEIVIGNVARFVKEKNHIFFIDYAKFLKKNGVNFKIILVGDGSLREKIKLLIKKNHLEKNFIITGVRDDVNNILHIFDVLLMPSIHEGFPVTIIEALASGTPCLLSNNIDNKVGFIEDMVSFVNLDDDFKIWYDEMSDLMKIKKSSKYIKDIFKRKKFDINSNVIILEDIYLNKR